ncbi:MAG: hypothetical protein WC545_03990 [Patescibacteria group bacterium]
MENNRGNGLAALLAGKIEALSFGNPNLGFWALFQQLLIFLSFKGVKDWENLTRNFVDVAFKYIGFNNQGELDTLRGLSGVCFCLEGLNGSSQALVHEALKKTRNNLLLRRGGVLSYLFNKGGLEVLGVYTEAEIFRSRWDGFAIREPQTLKSPIFEVRKDVTVKKILQSAADYYKKRGIEPAGEDRQSISLQQGNDYYVFSVTLFSGKKNDVALCSEEKTYLK